MGSGEKFQIDWWTKGSIGLGIWISNFPHELSIQITLLKVSIYMGFGKGYDEV
jgi:hypothetical protein